MEVFLCELAVDVFAFDKCYLLFSVSFTTANIVVAQYYTMVVAAHIENRAVIIVIC